MASDIGNFYDINRSIVLIWLKKLPTKIQYKKRVLPFIKRILKSIKNIFAENIFETWLLRKWSSRVGYLLLFASSLMAIIIADQFEFTRQFIHAANANEAIVGAFTILLALLIPLSIALMLGDSNNPFGRLTMLSTTRFRLVLLALVFISISLFIPSGIHIAGESLTLKNLYSPVLICCAVLVIMSSNRAIRWIADESSLDSSSPGDNKQKNDGYGDSSYQFAQVMRLLENAKKPQIWMAIWSQRFPIGYEDTIHKAFFDRVNDVINNKRRKQYPSVTRELQAYNANFDNRNQLSPSFEYQNPEKFFILFGRVEKILEEHYTDSRLYGLWGGKDALKSISIKTINSLTDGSRIWSLFQAMNKYVADRGLLNITGKEMKDDELARAFLSATFDAIKSDKVSAHDALSEVKADSGWAVTYDHLYGNKRYNLSFLVEHIYQKWLNDLLDQQKEKEYFMFNDSIVEHIFPGTDPITIGKLYWLVHLAHSSDYLRLWVKEFRPIGLVNFTGGFEYVGEKTKEDMWNDYHKRANTQELYSIKLFCSRYFQYLRTDYMKLSENIEKARDMDRKSLSEMEIHRLDDFIRLAELITKFYEESDREREEVDKKLRPGAKSK